MNFHDIDIREDVIRGGIPRLLIEVDYTHPILSEIPNGTFGCGAPAEDNVYEDPYAAENYPWEVEACTSNQFQAQYHNITEKEYDKLLAKRDNVTLRMQSLSLIVSQSGGGVMMTMMVAFKRR